MNPSELRLYNWVWRVYAPYGKEITRFPERILKIEKEYTETSFHYQPIELTPELLEKAEWKLVYGSKTLWRKRGEMITSNSGLYAGVYGYFYYGVKLLSLHQFQNLYYAIKGK